ncbi:MAG: hypothetical protein FD174_14 [Geobacteraceae bacterium]|nr:MAG: hypothetical protein FD174_14 [Geobacteraceae bacterium]
MKVSIADIKDKALVFSTDESVGDYPILAAMQNAGECGFLSPIRLQLTVVREYDHIRVNGRVEARVRLNCSRCLKEYETEVFSSFTIFYTPAAGMPQDEEVELAEEDLISATYGGDEIDFTSEIAEQVAMEIPFQPLCKEDCRGLCTRCGADLNGAECGCDRTVENVKLSALKNFKIKK